MTWEFVQAFLATIGAAYLVTWVYRKVRWQLWWKSTEEERGRFIELAHQFDGEETGTMDIVASRFEDLTLHKTEPIIDASDDVFGEAVTKPAWQRIQENVDAGRAALGPDGELYTWPEEDEPDA